MTFPDSGPRAIFGGPLQGHNLSHNIYIDEAGQSDREPVTVVVGVVVDVMAQWKAAEAALGAVFDQMVPRRYRPDFYFHAKEIWGSQKYREGWPKEDRLAFMKRVMALPMELELPIVIGKVRRDAGIVMADGSLAGPEEHHVLAFGLCVEKADYYLRNYRSAGHLATVICESAPGVEKKLVGIVRDLQQKHMFMGGSTAHFSTPESRGVHPGLIPLKREQSDRVGYHVERVIDRVHFVEKGGAPILQMADALAFAFRRFLSDQEYGEEFVDAAVGTVDPGEWRGPFSQCLWIAPAFALRHRNEGATSTVS